jgi:hypothetical protein
MIPAYLRSYMITVLYALIGIANTVALVAPDHTQADAIAKQLARLFKEALTILQALPAQIEGGELPGSNGPGTDG